MTLAFVKLAGKKNAYTDSLVGRWLRDKSAPCAVGWQKCHATCKCPEPTYYLYSKKPVCSHPSRVCRRVLPPNGTTFVLVEAGILYYSENQTNSRKPLLLRASHCTAASRCISAPHSFPVMKPHSLGALQWSLDCKQPYLQRPVKMRRAI